MEALECDWCLNSFGRLELLDAKISYKHIGSEESNTVSSFSTHLSVTKIFNDVKTQFMSGLVEIGWVERKRLVYLCRLDYIVGSYPVKTPGLEFERRKNHWVKVVCGKSKCKNPSRKKHFRPKLVISMHPESPVCKKKRKEERKFWQTGCRNTMKKRIKLK